MLLAIAVLLSLLRCNGSSFNVTLEYYKQLISKNQLSARDYKLPINNLEFKLGIESEEIIDFGEYDFVVVGSGTAGSVVATRLSEIKDWKILVLEAGGDDDDFSDIPNMASYLQFSPKNWGYYSIPQNNSCLSMINRQCFIPRGKVLGGSSTINYLLYTRGDLKNYDSYFWPRKEILKYFKKSEFSDIDDDFFYHGHNGPWNVESSISDSPLVQSFIQGNIDLGQPYIRDYNSQRIGISRPQLSTSFGRRASTSRAFLNRARRRDNLKILTNAFVTEVIIERKIARGVFFAKNGRKYKVKARKEVVLSAGAINTPQILMLSGLGPESHLNSLGITTIEDLQVGENLIEHPLFPGLTFRTNITSSQSLEEEISKYIYEGQGILTNPVGVQALGFLKPQGSEVAVTEYLMSPPSSISDFNISLTDKMYNYNSNLKKNWIDNIDSRSDILFSVVLLQSRSRGRVFLESSSPLDFPNVDLNMFSDQKDISNIVEGIKFVLKVAETRLEKFNVSLNRIPLCEDFEMFSDGFWECAVRHLSGTCYHACGTTRLGVDKRSSVVDGNLKVHGIRKLRVVDAGVIPEPVSGHINAPVVMIAERISDVIKRDYLNW